jgi:hypothetical protein
VQYTISGYVKKRTRETKRELKKIRNKGNIRRKKEKKKECEDI